LSAKSLEWRKKNPSFSLDRNVAVIEYTLPGQLNPIVEVFPSAPRTGPGTSHHSEQIAASDLPPNAKVTRVFSERSPCSDCWTQLRTDPRFQGSSVEYSAVNGNNVDIAAWKSRAGDLISRGR